MVWRISNKKEQPSKEDIQQTAMIGLAVIIGLGIIAWGIQHLQYIGQNMSKTFKEFAEACWDSHKQVGTKMKGGKRVPNCVPKNEEIEDDSPDVVKAVETAIAMANKRKLQEKKVKITKNGKELLVWDAELRTYQQMGWELVESSAMRALRRRNAKNARTQKTIAKYGQAAKMGIPASQVNQRRTAVTRKKI